MPCVDFAEAKVGVPGFHGDSHHCRARTEIMSAVMEVSATQQRRISANLLPGELCIGKEHCSELVLGTIATIPSAHK